VTNETLEALAWAELQHRAGIHPRYVRNLDREIGIELARCFDPVVHEQDIRPYGAIVVREMPNLDRLGRVMNTDGLTLDVIRSLADGRQTLLLAVKDHSPQLLVLDEPVETEQDYASHAVWIDGVIICNDRRGLVRIVTDSSVTLVEGRRWTTTNLVYEAAADIVGMVPAADARVVHRLLELTHHDFSANRIGVTLLYALTPDPQPTKRRNAGISLATLGLSVLEERDHSMLVHQARYRDGALLITLDGTLLAVNVILRPSRTSEHEVAAMKGTRHTSAARHTYDCPDVVAFVVSTDGPVTVFSDGKRIAELKTASPPPPPKTADRIAELIAQRRAKNVDA
jgi:DisA bacterial checkpoint controller nucleotide-binding